MIPRVILDTGPLVALLDADDAWHERCVKQLHALAPPLLTTWPVLTEAAWLLRSHPEEIQHMMLWTTDGTVKVHSVGNEASSWIAAFLRKYRTLAPQLADASLVYLAECENLDTICTLDRSDFSVYRFGRNRRFRLLPE